MNKKRHIVAPVSLKTYLILIAIAIISLWAYFNYISTGTILPITINKECPKNIIPERVNVTCLKKTGELCNPGNYWDDSTPIKRKIGTGRVSACELGEKEGENINYHYCKELLYENTPVDEEGNVGKTTKIEIELILDSKDYNIDESSNRDQWRKRDFKVISSVCS